MLAHGFTIELMVDLHPRRASDRDRRARRRRPGKPADGRYGAANRRHLKTGRGAGVG